MLINSELNNMIVDNPMVGYPSVGLFELINTVRLDKSKGENLLEEKIKQAMDSINHQLIDFPLPVPLSDAQTRSYKRAVCHEAAALIAEDNLDFDTSSTGQVRGENGLAKLQSLRRVVNYAIADLTSRTRNRVRLI